RLAYGMPRLTPCPSSDRYESKPEAAGAPTGRIERQGQACAFASIPLERAPSASLQTAYDHLRWLPALCSRWMSVGLQRVGDRLSPEHGGTLSPTPNNAQTSDAPRSGDVSMVVLLLPRSPTPYGSGRLT